MLAWQKNQFKSGLYWVFQYCDSPLNYDIDNVNIPTKPLYKLNININGILFPYNKWKGFIKVIIFIILLLSEIILVLLFWTVLKSKEMDVATLYQLWYII